MSILKKTGYVLVQCTWGIIQTLIGAVIFLLLAGHEHRVYRCCIVTGWGRSDSVSLGLFVFLSESLEGRYREEVLIHEYGHTIQSLMLGVIYPFVISIPSAVWCLFPYFIKRRERTGISYYSFYPERWANRLGRKVTGEHLSMIES